MFNAGELLQLRKEAVAIQALLSGAFDKSFKELEAKAKSVEALLAVANTLKEAEAIRAESAAEAARAEENRKKVITDLAAQKTRLDAFEAELEATKKSLDSRTSDLESNRATLERERVAFKQFWEVQQAELTKKQADADQLRNDLLKREQELSAQTDKVNAAIRMLKA